MLLKPIIIMVNIFINIFSLPQKNINNDKITANTLIRNKIQSNKVYDFEIRNLENLIFLFTQKFQNNQSKQDKIRQPINTNGKETAMRNTWVINKKTTIKAQDTNLNDCEYDSLGNVSPAYDDNKID